MKTRLDQDERETAGSKIQSELEFRRDLVSAVMECIRGGESCALVGVSGVGKSALLRRIRQPHVKAHYLDEKAKEASDTSADNCLFVITDCNLLVEPVEWGLFELMGESTARALADLTAGSEAREKETAKTGKGLPELGASIEKIVQETRAARETALAQRNLSQIIRLVSGAGFTRIVFFLDEFDAIAPRAEPRVLNNLRGLRDEYRPRVIYVTLTRSILPLLRRDIKKVAEGFNEMFRNTYAVTPYTRSDARVFISELTELFSTSLPEQEVAGLIRATGGHAGLIKAGFEYLRKRRAGSRAHLWDEMLSDPIVRDESKKIWQCLDVREQDVLRKIARRETLGTPERDIVQNLSAKGLVTGKAEHPVLFCHLFAEYVSGQKV